ncbi:PLDc N-terminal domain-containing protein [Candidatus Symbiothrix dinenymphae]|uniref:PLDc N-terminal domain-containing protein n=1 Tax=Candidatus Symbiothrix dinenymphae TaxID=467085 RepID=UPI000AA171CE
MKYLVLLAIVLSLLVYILTAIKIYKEGKSGIRINPIWLLVVLFLPLIGPLIFLSVKNHK